MIGRAQRALAIKQVGEKQVRKVETIQKQVKQVKNDGETSKKLVIKENRPQHYIRVKNGR